MGTDSRRGAIIVSFEECKGRRRPRAESDVKGMESLLKLLNFRVEILRSKRAVELREELKNLINNISRDAAPKCFVCFVSAYGNTESDDRQFILDQEGEKVYVVDDIIKPFMACKELDDKPRVFFVNICTWNYALHGSKPEQPVKSKPKDLQLKRSKRLKDRRDLLAVFSTEEEHQLGQQTCFVPAFLCSLRRDHNNKPVEQIVNEANLCQSISVTNTLENELFWRTHLPVELPGIVTQPDPIGKRLLEVYRTPNQCPELDVVLFHGYEFGGKGWYPAPLSTWFTSSPHDPACWPVEWLPGQLGLPMRVFCIKYSEAIENPAPCPSNRKLKELAEQVRKDLGEHLLEETASKPLIFIGHGLGGLLIQEILNSKEGYVRRLNERLRGIVFYGVPYEFRSGPKENFSLPALENALKQEDGCLSVMEKSEVKEVMDAIKSARNNFKKYKDLTLSFEEGNETHGSKVNLVAAQSYATKVNTIVESCLTCNHFDVCKPATATEEMFTLLLRFIRKQLHNPVPEEHAADVIVGQDAHREKLKKCLMARGTTLAGITGSDTFGVVGMGGIGKTTLAKSLFEDNEIKEYYDHRVYWIAIKRKPVITECQKGLIYEICKEMPAVEFNTEELLRQELQKKLLERKRVLLFLDDVWEKDDVEKMLGRSFMQTLPPESKCIITSRKPAELEKLGEKRHIEKLDVLEDKDARTLFCSKAFLNRKMPSDKEFREIVEEVIKACGNMPILLASVGAARWGKKDIKTWVEVRDRLRNEKTAENESDEESAKYLKLIEQLMISYDDLPEGDRDGVNLKDFFLDFAAFPEREEIEIAVLMDLWTKPGLTEDGAYRILEELEQRCLVKIDGYWCYVHDVFRALAIKIVEKASLKERKRLFAWGIDDFSLSQEWNTSDSREQELVMFETEKMVIARSGLIEFHPRDSILFRCFTRLRMLLLTSNLNLVSLPSEIGCLTSLEKLDLSWCFGLKVLPGEIGQLESLQKLNMAGCCSLTALPPEIGRLKKLMELNMQSCGIKELPEEIGELTCLTWLCLNDCNQLGVLPDALGKLRSLVRLECDMLPLQEIPKSLGDLSNLKYLSFGACHRMSRIPVEFVKLKNLISLWCVNTLSLKVVPDVLDELVTQGSLRVFNVYGTGIRWESLPPHLRALPKPFDGFIKEPEVDATADNLDGPFWKHKRGMLVDIRSLYDPSNKDERRLSFGLLRVVTLAKMEKFLSPRFNMAIRIMYTMCNHGQTRHAIVKYGGIPVLLRCIAEGGDHRSSDYAAATISNICVTPSTHKAIVDAQGLHVLTRALHRRDHVASSAFIALNWIRDADKLEKDFTFTSDIYEKCGHTFGHAGCACIWCQHQKGNFLTVKDIF